MEIAEIKELLKAFDNSKSTFFDIEQEGLKLKLKKETAPKAKAVVVTNAAEATETVQAAKAAGAAVDTETSEATESVEEAMPQEEGQKVIAPLVGVFYAAASPDADAYVQVGSRVEKGQVLCLIEAMKMMNEITAPCDGLIKKIYVKNQDIVEFQEPLFLIGD